MVGVVMAFGGKILWGIIALVLLNTFMGEIINWIVGQMDLSVKFFSWDLSGFIEGAIAAVLNAIVMLFIYYPSDSGSVDE